MFHGGCGLEDQEEEHSAPSYNIQAVQCDEKSGWCLEETPEGGEPGDNGLLP